MSQKRERLKLSFELGAMPWAHPYLYLTAQNRQGYGWLNNRPASASVDEHAYLGAPLSSNISSGI